MDNIPHPVLSLGARFSVIDETGEWYTIVPHRVEVSALDLGRVQLWCKELGASWWDVVDSNSTGARVRRAQGSAAKRRWALKLIKKEEEET